MIKSEYIKVFWFVFLRVFDTDVFESKASGFSIWVSREFSSFNFRGLYKVFESENQQRGCFNVVMIFSSLE